MQSAIAGGGEGGAVADGWYDGTKRGNGVFPGKRSAGLASSISGSKSVGAAIQHWLPVVVIAANAQQQAKTVLLRLGPLMSRCLVLYSVRDEQA